MRSLGWGLMAIPLATVLVLNPVAAQNASGRKVFVVLPEVVTRPDAVVTVVRTPGADGMDVVVLAPGKADAEMVAVGIRLVGHLRRTAPEVLRRQEVVVPSVVRYRGREFGGASRARAETLLLQLKASRQQERGPDFPRGRWVEISRDAVVSGGRYR
ncbi:MAG TPA: hypothetical protein VLH75_14425 [Longimicrobiales bacterium]|nr:hypothetical protein [Longimicrobiales bacterium]